MTAVRGKGYGSLNRSIPAGSVGQTVRRGLMWTVAGQWGAYIVQMATTTIALARFLSAHRLRTRRGWRSRSPSSPTSSAASG